MKNNYPTKLVTQIIKSKISEVSKTKPYIRINIPYLYHIEKLAKILCDNKFMVAISNENILGIILFTILKTPTTKQLKSGIVLTILFRMG